MLSFISSKVLSPWQWKTCCSLNLSFTWEEPLSCHAGAWLSWSPFAPLVSLESIFHFKCKHLTEASHQTKPTSYWLHSCGNLVNLENFTAFYFVQKERHLWKSFCTGSSDTSAESGGQCWFQPVADCHLVFLFSSLTIQIIGVSSSFIFQNSVFSGELSLWVFPFPK